MVDKDDIKMDCKSLRIRLPSGNYMPLIGFGTYKIRGAKLIREVLDYALAAGYRHVDTAAVYGNEADIGKALKELLSKYKLTREDIFITSKLSPSDQGSKAFEALKTSLSNLDCGYLDLYLIHWPGVGGIPVDSLENSKLRSLSWQNLVKGVQAGLVKDIGVSNYTVRHLKELLDNNFGIKPAVNQVEWHPHCHQSELKKFCKKSGVFLQAYSSLGGSNNTRLLNDPVVNEISVKLQRSPAQILLRWALQQNIGIIPKARTQQHIEANIDLSFVIPEQDMNRLGSIKDSEKYAWNPENVI